MLQNSLLKRIFDIQYNKRNLFQLMPFDFLLVSRPQC